MSFFLDAQPEAARADIAAAMASEVVHMAILVHLDFASNPLRLSTRNVPFTDVNGVTWQAGAGLLVSIDDVSGADAELAPYRDFRIGLPSDMIDGDDWRAGVVSEVLDRQNYLGRALVVYGQLFRETGGPLGVPFAMDSLLMDKMTFSASIEGMVVMLRGEGLLARKGVPVYGLQTFQDQKRRYPTDEGMQFTTESGKLITWTDF